MIPIPRAITPYYMLRKTKVSPTGYMLQMPIEKRTHLIHEINQIINSLLVRYNYPYFIKKILKKSNQESKEYVFIIEKLLRLSRIHKNLSYSDCFDLFYIMLEIYDYISAKSQSDIAKNFIRYKGFIKELAKLTLEDPEDYKNRFPSTKHSKNMILHIANNIISGTISQDEISNIDSFEFQQIINAYRREVVRLETNYLSQKGYPSIGSRAFNDRVRDFQRKNLFDRNFLGCDFIEWVEGLTDSELKQITRFFSKSILKRDLLIICNKINQNHEILKYIIYLILKSNDSLKRIAEKSGKQHTRVRRIGKILDLNICPVSNTYYIKSYEERFLK